MSMAESHSGIVEVRGGTLSYDVIGHGPSLVFIHSGIADRKMWDRELLTYPRTYRVIRYDLRGYGGSSRAEAPYSASKDLAELLDELGVDRANLVGSSVGGNIALEFAKSHPSRVLRLVAVNSGWGLFGNSPAPSALAATQALEEVLVAATRDWRERNGSAAVERILQSLTPRVQANLRLHLSTLVRRNLKEILTGHSQNLRTAQLSMDDLSTIEVPTLIISGTQDHPALRYSTLLLRERMAHPKWRSIEGADHLPNLSSPEEFTSEISRFISG